MPIKYVQKQKPKAQPKVEVVDQAVELEEMVDTLGELKAKIDPLKAQLDPLVKAYNNAEAALLAIVDEEFDAAVKAEVVGTKYAVKAGPKAKATVVTDLESAATILEEIEDGLFMLLAKVGITDLRKYMTPDQFEAVTSTDRTGKRKVSVENLPG